MPQTGMAALDWFLALLDTWGYLIVFGFTIFENLFVIGSLTPGETVVIAASFLAERGLLILAMVWLSSFAGTLTGSNVSYLLGKRFGLDGVKAFTARIAATRVGRLLRIHAGDIDEVHDHFHTEGAKTVFIARFAIGAKNFVPAMAGATGMPLFWFELYTMLGAALYTSLMCGIGWFLGENLDRALGIVRNISLAGLIVFIAFVAFAVVARRRLKARRAAKRSQAT